LLPDIEIVHRKPLRDAEQMLREQLASRIERCLAIDIAVVGQDIAGGRDDLLDGDAIDVTEGRLDRARFRERRRAERRDKLFLDFGIDALRIVVVREDIIAEPF
jgi:hypothetical protein